MREVSFLRCTIASCSCVNADQKVSAGRPPSELAELEQPQNQRSRAACFRSGGGCSGGDAMSRRKKSLQVASSWLDASATSVVNGFWW
jgi:hypothetical protein